MRPTVKLPLSFDPVRLRADLQRVEPGEWVAHFNTAYYEGDWSAAALRSVGGVTRQIYPDPTATPDRFADTEILARCAYIREVLASFRCPVQAARLLRLDAGAVIREHRDYRLGYEDGEVRLHVPVQTNDEVEFRLGGERVLMREGECWYLDFNLPHAVANRGATPRVHLVIDCTLDDWLRSLFPPDEVPGD